MGAGSNLFSSIRDNLVRGSLVLFMGNLTGSACNYFFQFLMSRSLSVSDFGAMNSLLSLVMIATVPASSLLLVPAKYVSNFMANGEPEKVRILQEKLLATLTRYGFVVLLLALLSSPWFARYLHIASPVPVIIAFLLILCSFIVPINFGTLQGLQRFPQLGRLAGASGLMRLGFGAALVVLGLRLNGAMLAVLCSSLVLLFMSFWYLRGLPRTDPHVDDLGIGVRRIAEYSLPVVLSSLGIVALTNLDLILVKHYFAPEEAGLYAAVAVLGRTIFYLPGVVVTAMFPVVSESFALRKNTLPLLRKAVWVTMLLGGSGLLIFLLVPDLMLSFLFGRVFSQGAPFLRIFALAMFCMAITNVVVNFQLAVEKNSFLVALLAGCLTEITLISFFHESLLTVLLIVTGINLILLTVVLYQVAKFRFDCSHRERQPRLEPS
jgi:O-antigen/teichoic acid export membrane protein